MDLIFSLPSVGDEGLFSSLRNRMHPSLVAYALRREAPNKTNSNLAFHARPTANSEKRQRADTHCLYFVASEISSPGFCVGSTHHITSIREPVNVRDGDSSAWLACLTECKMTAL